MDENIVTINVLTLFAYHEHNVCMYKYLSVSEQDLFGNMADHVKCQGRWHLQAPRYKQKHYTK